MEATTPKGLRSILHSTPLLTSCTSLTTICGMETNNIKTTVQQSLEDMKAQDIYQLDISKKSSITGLMFIATGRSTRHVKAIADNVVFDAKKKNHAPLGVEGEQGSNWVLVDLDDVVVHVMTQQARDFYNLEKFWETEFTKKEDVINV